MPPTTLRDHLGSPIELGARVASGGEGAVFALAGDPTRLAKVYHQPPGTLKAEKLYWMVQQAAPELCRFTAWPTATLHDAPGGRPVGFLMPRFDGYLPVHTLYSPAHRRASFPDADWAFLIAAAMNCAAAFDAVHEQGHVIGDVNQSNVLVSRQALACLIDCDSFQIKGDGKVYRCEVGVGPYTPPELQGVNFRAVDRTANHDRFGLAVLIFHLLFMGRHPFAGRFLGPGDLTLEQAIVGYRFVYSEAGPETGMAPPPFALPLRAVSPRLAGLFERAFTRGSERPGARPAASEWYAALHQFASQLRTCPKDAGHKVPAHLAECPWCGFLERGGPNFFLGVGLDAAAYQADTALLMRLWDQVQALKPQTFRLPALVLPPPPSRPAPSPGSRLGRRLAELPITGLTILLICGAWAWLVFSGKLFAGSGFWGTLLLFCVAVYFLFLVVGVVTPPLERLEKWLKERFPNPDTARGREAARFVQETFELSEEWVLTVRRYEVEFRRLKDGLRGVRKEAGELQNAFLGERYELERSAALRHARAQPPAARANPAEEAAAREHFLRSCFLSDHKIPGFGSGRLALLASYGVETAFDLTEESLEQIRGIGPKLRQTLLSWKEEKLREFRYDPAFVIPGSRLSLVPPEEMKALVLKFKHHEEELRSRLQKGIQDLTSLTRHAEQELENIARRRNDAAVRAVQAGIDPAELLT